MEKQQLAIIALFSVAGWIAWLVFSTVRYYIEARARASGQDKLLLRVSSPETLQAFLASPAGANFLGSLEPDPNEAWRGIIRTTQSAVIFGVLGVVMLACRFTLREAEGLLPFAIGSLAFAAAFGASAFVSSLMHRRVGLLSDSRR